MNHRLPQSDNINAYNIKCRKGYPCELCKEFLNSPSTCDGKSDFCTKKAYKGSPKHTIPPEWYDRLQRGETYTVQKLQMKSGSATFFSNDHLSHIQTNRTLYFKETKIHKR